MSIKQALLLVLAAVAVLASAAGAGHDTARQRIAITFGGFASPTPPASAKFGLVPLTTGALRGDSGTSSIDFGWQPDVIRDGQTIEIEGGVVTGRGKRGGFAIRYRNEWVAAGNAASGYRSGTGTWKFLRGTGQYAGVTGSGRSGLVYLERGRERFWARYEGLLEAP